MDVFEAVKSRRTIREMRSDPISNDTLNKILEAAVWAPNHKLTQPWRFTIFGPQSRFSVALAVIDYRIAKMEQRPDEGELENMKQRIFGRFVHVGALVAVTCVVNERGSEHARLDDFASTCAAIQNMQLVAWGEGIGACWMNGAVTRMERMDEILEIKKRGERLIGVVSLGYPAHPPQPATRLPVSSLSRILL
jgi:nitroreductase